MKGKVKWFDPIRGYGFLLTDDGKEHFVHISDLKYSGYDTLTIDELIEFDIVQYGERFKAINLKKVLQNHLDTDDDFHSFLYTCLTNKDLEKSAEKGKGDVQIEQAIGFLFVRNVSF